MSSWVALSDGPSEAPCFDSASGLMRAPHGDQKGGANTALLHPLHPLHPQVGLQSLASFASISASFTGKLFGHTLGASATSS
jgi:hypothetical protein